MRREMHGVQFDTEYTEKLKLSRIYIGLNYSKVEIAVHYFINFIIVILYIISIIRLIFNIHTTIAFQNLKINIVHDFDLYQMKSDHEDSSRWMCILY